MLTLTDTSWFRRAYSLVLQSNMANQLLVQFVALLSSGSHAISQAVARTLAQNVNAWADGGVQGCRPYLTSSQNSDRSTNHLDLLLRGVHAPVALSVFKKQWLFP